MPRDNRLDNYLGGWNSEWTGSTQTERKFAQNQYDIIQTQEQNK